MISRKLAIAATLLLASTASLAQMTSISSAGVRGVNQLDVNQSSVNDPAAIDLLFKEGNSLTSILEGLKEKGFNIEYKKQQVPPTMTLVSLPKSSRIDDVLREMLAPWDLAVYHSPYGKWVVRPGRKKEAAPSDAH